MELTKKYIINGPNNIIRLTDGKKIIYIFGDVHLDINSQNTCKFSDKNDSIDFDQFLVKFMKNNTKEEYDLFIEQTLNQVIQIKKIERVNEQYIQNVRRIFSKNINFVNNKITKSEDYPNFRFHYFDFRFDIPEFENIFNIIYTLPSFNALFENIDYFINTLNYIKNNVETYYKKINENSENDKIRKIFTKYNNKKLQKKIITIINEYFKNIFYNKIINIIDDTLEYIYTNYDTIKNKYLSMDYKLEMTFYIENKIKNISFHFYNFFQLSDIYLIRRILDKDYNKKSIIYTGVAHLGLITYFLVKYFDFKITNLFHTQYDLKLIETDISNKNYNILRNYFVNMDQNDEVVQCVNLFDFPNNMS